MHNLVRENEANNSPNSDGINTLSSILVQEKGKIKDVNRNKVMLECINIFQ